MERKSSFVQFIQAIPQMMETVANKPQKVIILTASGLLTGKIDTETTNTYLKTFAKAAHPNNIQPLLPGDLIVLRDVLIQSLSTPMPPTSIASITLSADAILGVAFADDV